MINTLIFDLDGVCFDIDWFKVNDKMIKKFGISTLIKSLRNKKILTYYKKALEGKRHLIDMFKELDKNNNNLEDVIDFYKKMYKKYKNHNGNIYKLIKRLKNKFTVVCLSDTNSVHYESHKEQKTIKCFHRVFTSFQIGSTKRNVNTFKKVLSELSIIPKDVVFIDNIERNVKLAKSIGIHGIKYTNYNDLIKRLKKYGCL